MPEEPAVPMTPAPLAITGAGWTLYGPEGSVSIDEWDGLSDVLYEKTPNNDLVEHTLDGECICDPKLLIVGKSSTGNNLWMSLHSSADGRELAEPDTDELPRAFDLIDVTVSLDDIPAPVQPERADKAWFKSMHRVVWTSDTSLMAKLRDSSALVIHYLMKRSQESF